MQALFTACKEVVAAVELHARSTDAAKEESLKLGRFIAKVALLMAELELECHANEELLGSQRLFLAVETILSAVQQAEGLIKMCSSSSTARIWPLEDAVEFQSVALEVLEAVSKLASLDLPVPEDVKADIAHVQQQLKALQFTQTELEESEDVELADIQQINRKAREAAESCAAGQQDPNLPAGMMASVKISPSGASRSGGAMNEEWEGDGEDKEEDDDATNGIPPPDETIMEAVESGQVVVVPTPGAGPGAAATALPPGVPVKGAVKGSFSVLPSDPFSMAEGEGVGRLLGAGLATTTMEALDALKQGGAKKDVERTEGGA